VEGSVFGGGFSTGGGYGFEERHDIGAVIGVHAIGKIMRRS